MRRSRPISRVLSWTVIPLGATSPLRSSNLPGPDAGRVMRSLFGLAPGGVCRAGLLPGSRCALTAPFHPCLCPATPLPSLERLGRLRRQVPPLLPGSGKGVTGPFGGIFLLHFPSTRAAQALPGTVPCGARTFLGIVSDDATVWPAPPHALSHRARDWTRSAQRKRQHAGERRRQDQPSCRHPPSHQCHDAHDHHDQVGDSP